jgi:hypothetical protein
MKIAGIPRSIITANTAVVQELATAGKALQGLTPASRGLAGKLEAAMAAVSSARAGVAQLGRGSILDGAVGRWALHAERDLQGALQMASRSGRLSADGVEILASQIDDARGSVRMATQAGERSLASPARRDVERATSFASSGADTAGGSPVWVDGEWLDDLGNPVRGNGGGTWSGPDGQSFGWDGSPVRSGGGDFISGPDGATYAGI